MKKIYSLKQNIIEMKYSRQDSLGNVFMFHQINNDRNLWDDISCCISQKSFEIFIKELAENDAIFGNVNRSFLSEPLNGKTDLRVIITFDDVYDDVYYNCYPLLYKLGIPFTIFVTWNYIGENGYLTKQMITEMLDSGLCTVGSHTISHPVLRKLTKEEVLDELMESKRKLSNCFDVDVDTMAYPYGSLYACSKSNIDICGISGYDVAFSTINSHLTVENLRQKMFIPRRNVNENNYRELLRCWNARN